MPWVYDHYIYFFNSFSTGGHSGPIVPVTASDEKANTSFQLYNQLVPEECYFVKSVTFQ